MVLCHMIYNKLVRTAFFPTFKPALYYSKNLHLVQHQDIQDQVLRLCPLYYQYASIVILNCASLIEYEQSLLHYVTMQL